jgi:ATP-dependent helicase/nuclease subunit A
VFLAGTARHFNRMDIQRPLLMHPGLGVGPRRLELDRMLEYPTLPRLAVAQQLDAELRAEELRLLYVAMTRAREHLVLVCAAADASSTLKKLGEVWSAPADPQALAALPSVSEWLLLAALGRPEAQELRAFAGPVGILPAEAAGAPWKISLLSCGKEEERARTEALSCGAAGPGAQDLSAAGSEGADELPEHLFEPYPYAAQTEIPSKLTATQLKGRPEDSEAAEDAPRPPKSHTFRRPRFAMEERGLTPTERGTAIHLAMQHIDFQKTGSIDEIRAEIIRLVEHAFLSPEQGESVDPAVLAAFFASPLGLCLKHAANLTREFKFSVLLPAQLFYPGGGDDPVLLQGVVDCFWEEDGSLAVLDFKSDRVSPGGEAARAAEYKGQLDAYSRALTEITNLPVKRRILYFFATGCALEVP